MTKDHNCKDLVLSLSDYVDGSLSEDLCHELEKHLQNCENCKVVVDTLKKTIDIVREQKSQDKIPVDVKQRLFYRLNLAEFGKEEEP
jgi:anti-sigma factor (TIGR02949 family)